MIYLDNAATTKVFDSAVDAANKSMRDCFFNPNTTYTDGVSAHKKAEADRRALAELIGAEPGEIFYTSCATESNNWAISCGRKNTKGNIVISAGEHPSIYEPAMQLKNRGVDVRIVPLTSSGCVDEGAFSRAVDANTSLVSIIHVSNETGVINPIGRLCAIAKRNNPRVLFHSDGVQALLKLGEPIGGLGVNLYSASAHKIGAPKGIGILYIKKGISIAPMLLGGGQENGMRSGTQNTPYIAAFSAAAREFNAVSDRKRMLALRGELADMFVKNGCHIVGSGENSGYILCVCVPGVKAEVLQNEVNKCGVIIGKGSACSGSKRGNRVLSAMGLPLEQIECCIRLSFSADMSRGEAVNAANIIIDAAERIRSENV